MENLVFMKQSFSEKINNNLTLSDVKKLTAEALWCILGGIAAPPPCRPPPKGGDPWGEDSPDLLKTKENIYFRT